MYLHIIINIYELYKYQIDVRMSNLFNNFLNK